MSYSWLYFPHPEPQGKKRIIYPVFLPFAGCPFKCIYCSQTEQTGREARSIASIGEEVYSLVVSHYYRTGRAVALGFFGGTFTAMPYQDQKYLLEIALELKKNGVVNHLRCSTRPDFVQQEHIRLLQSYGVDMVELGIQSFDCSSLELAKRGYSGSQALAAARRLKTQGMELGIQLMPGLPGSNAASFLRDIEICTNLGVSGTRIYPCLVLQNTPLAKLWAKGRYSPWSLEQTTTLLSLALLRLWQADAPVIRMGLAPEGTLLPNILAGPWHPALGAICRGRALGAFVLSRIRKVKGQVEGINVPGRYQSDFWGYKKENAQAYAWAGLTQERVRFWNREWFKLGYKDY